MNPMTKFMLQLWFARQPWELIFILVALSNAVLLALALALSHGDKPIPTTPVSVVPSASVPIVPILKVSPSAPTVPGEASASWTAKALGFGAIVSAVVLLATLWLAVLRHQREKEIHRLDVAKRTKELEGMGGSA
jgi:hypothetical protein